MSLERLREQRLIWEAKPALRAVYGAWFDRLLEGIPEGTRVLEVGAGPGFLAEAAHARRPDLRWISSDLLGTPWNDLAADAGRLPFATGSVGAVAGVDVLHHLPRPAEFFRETARVLGGRGELRLVEPWITPLGWVVYRFFHQEDCRLRVDGWDPFPGGGKDSFDGNAAIPWRLFRDTPAWEWRRLGFEPPRRRRLNAWPYLLSLGFRRRSLLPSSLVGTLLALDRCSGFLSPLLALRAFLAWETARGSLMASTAPLSPP
jgi:SAM-dependent methyltransferase